MKDIDLPGQVYALINFIGKNTFVCTSYGGRLSDEWNHKNGVRQDGISPVSLIQLYLNEIIPDISRLSAGCNLFCIKSIYKVLPMI